MKRSRSITAPAIAAIAAMTAAALAPGAAAGPVQQADGFEESLGAPISFTNVPSSAITTNAAGDPLAVTIASGDPSVLSIVDALTGDLVHSEEVPGVSQAFGFEVASDRTVYIGAGGGPCYQVDPDTLEVTEIGNREYDQGTWWDVDQTPDGKVWFGTYPGGGITSWDPATRQWGDYVTFAADLTYVRSVAQWNGRVYAGTGTRAAVYEYDPATGTSSEIPLPDGYEDQTFVYDLDIAGDRMFARVSPSSTLLVYDLAAGEWVHEIAGVLGSGMPDARTVSGPDGERQVTYFVSRTDGGHVQEYDLDADTWQRTPLTVTQSVVGHWAWVDVVENGTSRPVLLGMDRFASIHRWDTLTGEIGYEKADVVSGRVKIRSLATGPDGAIYTAGYASNSGIARLDPETGETTMLVGPGQIEQFGSVGDDLLFGVYENAQIHDWDTTTEWEWGVTTGHWLVGQSQDRPTAIIDAGGLTAIGSVPKPGQLGGALALLDRTTGTMQTYRNVVQDQSPLTLVHKDGLIYGGTGIWGGLGIEPTTSEGKLFIFDVATREVVFETVPVPGSQNVSGLTLDDEGDVWGVTGSHIFEFDTDTREVVFRQQIIQINDAPAYWVGRSLQWHDGILVGMTSRKAFTFDPATNAYTELSDLGTAFAAGVAIDAQGRYYYTEDSELRRWTPGTTPGELTCDDTVTGTHSGPLSATSGVLCLEGATVSGPVSVGGGASLVVTDSRVAGPVQASDAAVVRLSGTEVTGPVQVSGTSAELTIRQNEFTGPVSLVGNQTGSTPIRLSGNTVTGPLRCVDNAPAPDDDDRPNTVRGPRTGQCDDV